MNRRKILRDDELLELARAVGAELKSRREQVCLAESCTGGLIAKFVTDIAGSSAWFGCGVVAYSNAVKQALLGVPGEVLERSGAVSAEAALAMAAGALKLSGAQWSIAVSGIAGPDGGSADKPVGTVWIAWTGHGSAGSASRFLFSGDRDAVRRQAAAAALQGLLGLLTSSQS